MASVVCQLIEEVTAHAQSGQSRGCARDMRRRDLLSEYPTYTHTHTHTHIYIYIYINNIFVSYILLNVSIHMYHLLGVLYFYFAS